MTGYVTHLIIKVAWRGSRSGIRPVDLCGRGVVGASVHNVPDSRSSVVKWPHSSTTQKSKRIPHVLFDVSY